jgi:hypothetical protein
MKRKGLNRKTPLKRTAIKRKPRRNDDPNSRYEWRQTHGACACCWAREGGFGCILHVHHMLSGRFGRKDHPANYLRLCGPCHDLVHCGGQRGASGDLLPTLTLGMQLTLKMETDIENYDRDWMQTVMGKQPLPEPEPLPKELLALRCT